MGRLTEGRDEQILNEDDRHAVRLLDEGPIAEGNTSRSRMSDRSASERIADPEQRVGHASLAISPMCHASAWITAVATMKAQAEGRFSPEAHWWGDVLAGYDLGVPGEKWHLLANNIPAAVSAGVRVEAIEAVRDDRLEDLTEDERQYVEFFRLLVAGSVTDACWEAQVALVGSERGVLELAYFYLHLHNLVRMGQTLGLEGEADDERVAEVLAGLRAGEWPLIDVVAYETHYRENPWPTCMRS